jgi:hypothetical protein
MLPSHTLCFCVRALTSLFMTVNLFSRLVDCLAQFLLFLVCPNFFTRFNDVNKITRKKGFQSRNMTARLFIR